MASGCAHEWLPIFAGLWFAPAVAHADPCEGRLPDRAGATFSGLVRYIGDGDSLCVGPSSDPSTWIEVRLSDFDAPELHSPTGRADRDRLSAMVACLVSADLSGLPLSARCWLMVAKTGLRRACSGRRRCARGRVRPERCCSPSGFCSGNHRARRLPPAGPSKGSACLSSKPARAWKPLFRATTARTNFPLPSGVTFHCVRS